MANKKVSSRKMGLYLGIGILFVAVVGAVLFLFLAAVKSKLTEQTYTGMQVVFGYTESAVVDPFNVEIQIFSFSFMNLLPLILALVGIILNVINKKIINLVGALCFVAAAVLFVFVPDFVVLFEEKATDLYELAVGSYIGVVFMAISAFLSICKTAFVK